MQRSRNLDFFVKNTPPQAIAFCEVFAKPGFPFEQLKEALCTFPITRGNNWKSGIKERRVGGSAAKCILFQKAPAVWDSFIHRYSRATIKFLTRLLGEFQDFDIRQNPGASMGASFA